MEDLKFQEFGKQFLTSAIPYSLLRCSMFLTNLIMYYYVGLYHDETMTIGLGVSISCYFFFVAVFMIQSNEVVGIYSIKYKGMGNYKLMRLSLYIGFYVNFIIVFLGFLFYLKIDSIQLYIGFEKQSVQNTHICVQTLVPHMMTQAWSENVKAYMQAMGFVRLFDLINGIQILLTFILGWLFIWHFQMGLVGFGVAKFFTEVVIIIVLVVAWDKYGDEETKMGKESLLEVFSEEYRFLVKEFLKFFAKCSLQNYMDYLGFEAITILLGIYGDQGVLTAWVSVANIIGITYLFGMGCGNSIRSFVGVKIGEEKYDAAKKISIMCLLWVILIALVWAFIIHFFVDSFASLFTGVDASKKVVVDFFITWSWIAPFDILWPCFVVLFKLVDRTVALTLTSLVSWVFIPPIFTYYGLFVQDMGGIASIYCWYVTLVLADSIGIIQVYFFTDWHTIPKLLEGKDENTVLNDKNETEMELL